MVQNTFIASVEGDSIYAINSATHEKSEVGITQKAAKALQDALSNIINERDEYYNLCVKAGLIEKKLTPEEMMAEALADAKAAREDARAARAESAKMMEMLAAIQDHLTKPKEN